MEKFFFACEDIPEKRHVFSRGGHIAVGICCRMLGLLTS